MDAGNSASVLWYRRSKPQGKVRRRVQDLRIPSSSYYDFIASRPALDLSHNESARLAADCLLSQGLKGYHEVLKEEGEVDFLSELEKSYILENRRHDYTDDPGGTDDDDDKELDSLSAGSRSPTSCSAVSTDSDPTLADLDHSGLRGVNSSGPVLSDSSIEVFFQSDSRAAGMKDVVRQFIRKAELALAIVMDSFSDVELLCDLLEASRKRNVSVHLLLDRLNLNLFLSMWQDLNLNSKNFPKLSVRSVHGQTYCSKTGRKLTGQIAASFIITDWVEVLTGSYSFSWLSWQVHRSLAVRMKGSSVAPFQQEFHRLYSSSKPVAGFVTFITLPHSLGLSSRSHEAHNNNSGITKPKSNQTKTTMCLWAWNEKPANTQTALCDPPGLELECGKGENQTVHRADTGLQTQSRSQQLYPKPLLQTETECKEQRVPLEKPQQTVGGLCAQPEARRNVEPLEMNQGQIHWHLNPPDQTYNPYGQSQLASFTIITTTEKTARVQEPSPLHTASPTHGQHRTGRYQSPLMKNSSTDQPDVATEGHFFQQRSRNVLTTGLNTQRGQWNYSLNLKPKVELPSDNPRLLTPSTPSQQQQPNSSFQLPFSSPRGHSSGLQTKISFLETRRQDHLQRHCQSPLQSHPNTDSPGPKSASTGMGAHLKPPLQTNSRVFMPGARMLPQSRASQQRINWTPQSNQAAARPGAVARHSSFSAAQGMGQRTGGQLGWRPFQSGMNSPLGRSKSMTDRRTAGFRGLNQNRP
nr:PREDICTED: protein FAM83A [Stegastes partitus]